MTESQMKEVFEHICPECGRISATKGGLAIHRRQVHGVLGARSQPKDLKQNPHKLGVVLYEALAAHADAERRVMLSLPTLCGKDPQLRNLFTGPKGAISPVLLRNSLQYLINYGSVRMNGNRVKQLIGHPDEIDPEERVQENGGSPVTETNGRTSHYKTTSPGALARLPKQKLDLMEAIDQVPPEVLADSISRKMWERYEWALSELGKMHAALEVKDAELHRLRLQLQECEPVGTKDAARLILS